MPNRPQHGVTMTHIMIRTTKSVIKYFLGKMESSANQKVGMKVILGLSYQCKHMKTSGFNVEQNQND